MHLFGLARGFGDVLEEKKNMWKYYRAELPAGIAFVFTRCILTDYCRFTDSKDQWTWLNISGLISVYFG